MREEEERGIGFRKRRRLDRSFDELDVRPPRVCDPPRCDLEHPAALVDAHHVSVSSDGCDEAGERVPGPTADIDRRLPRLQLQRCHRPLANALQSAREPVRPHAEVAVVFDCQPVVAPPRLGSIRALLHRRLAGPPPVERS